ncbi:MAG: hypothetical protein JF593_14645 [Novosphingobium sp.]|nr:hypothetical protein [Novosphingobium sp.]
MQTERVTFLTSREHKAALDAFAAASGQSVANVVREATAQYMAQPPAATEEGKALDLLVDELGAAIPKWNASFDSMEASIARARRSIREALAAVEATK